MSPAVRRVVSRLVDQVAECPAPMLYGRDAGSSASVAAIVAPLVGSSPVEVFGVLLLDARHRAVAWAEVSVGTLDRSLVHPREVFGPALRLGCGSLVLVHNHPSGDTSPSADDLELTKRLVEAGKLLGVPVLDHVVVGAGGDFHSLRADGVGF